MLTRPVVCSHPVGGLLLFGNAKFKRFGLNQG